MDLIRSRSPAINKLPKIVLLFISLTLSQQSHAQGVRSPFDMSPATNPDVLGITIGMTMQQAKETLGSSYKFMSAARVRDNPETEDVYAIAPKEVVSLETYRGKLIFINHLQVFTDSTRPNPISTRSALFQKYGHPVSTTSTTQKFGIGSKMVGHACNVDSTGFYQADPRVLRMAGIDDFYHTQLGFPDLNRETGACGTVVDVEFDSASVLSLDVSMHNIDEPLQAIAETRQQNSLRQLLNQGQNKPKL